MADPQIMLFTTPLGASLAALTEGCDLLSKPGTFAARLVHGEIAGRSPFVVPIFRLKDAGAPPL